ncbi:MAG: thiol:disulfide interchange protein DsbA/DsbL [Burkholderiales bacterium]|jgi:thiol:disulfide interchange protein DsbA|nr:thiol:disulfide interchange protein DsbA/DsbL [Burkholderiales bacterium]
MDRRRFSLNAASLAGALALAGAALPRRVRAQGATPVEERDYQTLARPVAVPPDGKIEVIEFFWYGCPHCFAFEPVIEPWIAQLPPDVHFRRVPVGFDARKQVHQRIFYTWEALGLVERMHGKTFARFHVQKKPIDSFDDMLVFAKENGLDTAKVENAWRSFGTDVKCKEANQLEDAYGIEYMPEMAVGGRFIAVAQPAFGHASVLATTDWLIDRVRQRR